MRSSDAMRSSPRRLARLILAFVLLECCAHAGGPRFVTGTAGWWVQSGLMMAFRTSAPLYFTDPGTLAANVTHAQSDALVAAAAAAWNVPTANLTLAQGGSLAEHVSSANMYFDGTDMVFPADVQAANDLAVPIAVLYDTNGSVIDTMLGSGASSPSSCRQNGVIESVDAFGLMGTIDHGIIVINGRCVGTGAALAPSLLQLQYQTVRAFGRVLGLAWAQVNDAVFIGASPLNAGMIANWPIMHPLDVVCGTYTYQCLTNPFTLRADDLGTLALLYPVTAANVTAGKVVSTANAVSMGGTVNFPTGQGMSMVNATVTRQVYSTMDTYEVVSGVTGVQYTQNLGNPVSGPESQAANAGDPWAYAEGMIVIPRVPESDSDTLWVVTTSVNPLYTGDHAIGPYQRPPVPFSGSAEATVAWIAAPGAYFGINLDLWDAPDSCNPGADGLEYAPVAFDASGWHSGLFCGAGHSSWFGVAIKAGHTWTLEATALDESGNATDYKAQPVLGVWNATDATGIPPTVAAQAAAMNSMSLGTTQIRMAAPAADSIYRFTIAEQFGGGRPDFAYNGRVLYADSVVPASAGASGGQIALFGTGFRLGNVVKVNGVNATVLSWSGNAIVLDVPPMTKAGATAGQPVSISVTDTGTNASTTIPNAFTYTAAPDTLVQVSVPVQVVSGTTAATPFAVRVMTADGLIAVPGAQVRVAVDPSSTGSVQPTACGAAASCVLTADCTGLVQTTVTGVAAGNVVLTATELSGGAQLSVTFPDADPQRSAAIAGATPWIAAGAAGSWNISLTAAQNGLPGISLPVLWSAPHSLTLTPLALLTDLTGQQTVIVSATNLPAGTLSVSGCAWVLVCASWTIQSVDASQWQVGVSAGAGQQIAASASFTPVTLTVTDGNGHPLQLATVTVYQRVEGYEGPCTTGRCAAAPTLATSQTTGTTDVNGNLSVIPLTSGTGGQVVAISASSGTQGFVSLTLVRTP